MTMTREPDKHTHASCLSLAQDWPGKSDKDGNEHPAIWHMLDVGTCAERLIDGHRAFASLSQDNRNALVVLVALHDVGKISETFRAMIRDRSQHPGTYSHWKLSDVLLTRPLDEILDDAFGGNVHARWALYAAVSGHHGGPERSNNRHEIARRKKAIGGAGEAAAIEWVSLLLELLPDGSLEGIDQHAAQRLSWALSGLTVASDWVASNTEWFPFAKPDLYPSRLSGARAPAGRAGDGSGRAGRHSGVHGEKRTGSDRAAGTAPHADRCGERRLAQRPCPRADRRRDWLWQDRGRTDPRASDDRIGPRARAVLRPAYDGDGERDVRPHDRHRQASLCGQALAGLGPRPSMAE